MNVTWPSCTIGNCSNIFMTGYKKQKNCRGVQVSVNISIYCHICHQVHVDESIRVLSSQLDGHWKSYRYSFLEHFLVHLSLDMNYFLIWILCVDCVWKKNKWIYKYVYLDCKEWICPVRIIKSWNSTLYEVLKLLNEDVY